MEKQRGRNILQTLNDGEFMKIYRLDCAEIMFMVDLITDVLTCYNSRVITALRYLATIKHSC